MSILLNRLNSCSSVVTPLSRYFHQSQPSQQIIKLTRLRCVDNSPIGKEAMLEGRPPKCIHVYNPTGVGTIGMYLFNYYFFLFIKITIEIFDIINCFFYFRR